MELIDREKIEWYGCNFETPRCESENRKCSECSHAECSHAQVMQLPSIKVPDNPTNGDMVKAIFPNIDIKSYINLSGMRTVDIDFKDDMFGGIYSKHTFSEDWWNAPYKGVEEWKQ